jgi:hypothetical protein
MFWHTEGTPANMTNPNITASLRRFLVDTFEQWDVDHLAERVDTLRGLLHTSFGVSTVVRCFVHFNLVVVVLSSLYHVLLVLLLSLIIQSLQSPTPDTYISTKPIDKDLHTLRLWLRSNRRAGRRLLPALAKHVVARSEHDQHQDSWPPDGLSTVSRDAVVLCDVVVA